MKRQLSVILLLLIMVLTGCNQTGSDDAGIDSYKSYLDIPGVTYDEIAMIEKIKSANDRLTYGHLLEMEAFLLPDGTYGGFTSEFCEMLSGLFGIEFVQVPYDIWQQLRIDVDSGSIDFTGDITMTSDMQYFATEPIADRTQKLVTLVNHEIGKESEVNGLRLGFLDNSVNLELIERSYPELDFEVVNVDYITSVEQMLLDGEIDAFVSERNFDVILEDKDSLKIKEFFPLAYASVSLLTADKELEPVISVINKYLASGGADTLNSLYLRGQYQYTKHLLAKSFSEDELAYINALSESKSSVLIALENDNYPISFYNETEGEFQGIAVDVLNEISELSGITFKNVTTKDTTWTEILEILGRGEVSLVSQLGYLKSREDSYIWSTVPYSTNAYALISKSDYPAIKRYQIPSLRIGSTRNTIYLEVYQDWFPDSDNLILYETQNEMLDALDKGEIDLVMGAENVLLTQLNYREKPSYKINFRFNASMDTQFGFNKNEIVLRSIIDKAQRQIDVKPLEDYWKIRVFDYSTKITEMRIVYLSILALLMFIALIAMFYLFITNRRLGKRLVEHSATLSTIYSSMPDTIFCKNTDGIYTSCNKSFEKQAGMCEAEIVGKTYSEVFGDRISNTIEQYAEMDKSVMTGIAPKVFEETVIYPDGSKRLLETLKAPMLLNGKVIGLMGIGRDVTERKEVKSRLESIINTAQIAFILTIDGIVVEANEYSKKHIGVQLGDDMRAFYSDPEERENIVTLADEQGTASNIIVRYKMANGENHRFLASFTSVDYEQRIAYLVWALDIERDELKEDRLRGVQQSFQTVLDALPVPIRIVDLESSELVYANDSLLELLEYNSLDELYGQNIMSILPDVMRDGTASENRVNLMLSAQNQATIEIEYRTKTDKIIEALVVTRQIDYQDRRSSIGIIKDLTSEKEQARVLMKMAESEKEANMAKSRFLANMSHEIRTPMNGVIGMTDLLLGESLSGRQIQYVRDIKTSAESLLGIINDILDISKITEGRMKIRPVDVDLNLMLKNTVSMMGFSAQSKGLVFIDQIHLGTPEYVFIDDVRLKQIIVNLLSNAIKFTREGSVTLTVKIEGDKISFEITDTGIGIMKEDLTQIFTAFERADSRKNRAIKGTGLGLSISKSLVELMGGNISVESEYGVGTTFFVSIPYTPGNESSVEVIDTVFEYISAPTAKVLLVDDIQTNLTVGAGLLRQCKITADVAISGFEAIELVKEKDYDIIFMDHMMPEMDGIEAMEHIKSMGGKFAEIPIIALTANAVNESRDLLLSAGMNDFLSKPIDKKVLMSILKKWLPADKVKAVASIDDDAFPIIHSQTLETAKKIEGLDIDLALDRIGGMQDVLEESIRQVAFSIGKRLKNMDNCLALGNLQSVAIDAHGLKGALANIGATINSELAEGLEIAAKSDNMPQCLERFVTFADIMFSFAKELKDIFPQVKTGTHPIGESVFLAQKVKEAINFLDKYETADAINCLNELENFTFGDDTDVILSEARNMIKAFKHKKAAAHLESIL